MPASWTGVTLTTDRLMDRVAKLLSLAQSPQPARSGERHARRPALMM